MAPESDALFLKAAVQAKLLDPEKGTAALAVYSQLKTMGAKFPFGQFLVDRGLLTPLARFALDSKRDIAIFSHLGDFEILDLLGEGQNATVFRARQISLDRTVALKILNSDFAADPANVRRFQAEARATARFSHPNIVQGFVTGSSHGMHFFAMEFIDGGSARSIAEASETGLDEPLALEIVKQTAEGLRAAHAAGFVHRDVKPDNILLTHDGQVKLADLGISQAARNPADEDTFWASPPYVAPEVVQGLESDARSDIYSLGATLFELLTARPPYQADTPREILNLHLTAPVPDVRGLRAEISPETSVLVQHMLVKQPEFRIQDAGGVVDAIQKILTPQPGGRSALKALPVKPHHAHGAQAVQGQNGPHLFHVPRVKKRVNALPSRLIPLPPVEPHQQTDIPQPTPPQPQAAPAPKKRLRRRYRPRR